MIQIAPSILSVDIAKITEAVQIVEEAGADLIHIDIMDGHFVPGLSFGPQLISSIKKETSLPMDVHLMVENPRSFIQEFSEAGADWISIHVEASKHLNKDINMIKEFHKKAGIALNPATPVSLINDILGDLDYVLLMTVNPGRGGQEFIPSCHSKISNLKKLIKDRKLNIPVEIDGGIKLSNIEDVIKDGADIIVSGSGIFSDENPRETIIKMKAMVKKYEQQ